MADDDDGSWIGGVILVIGIVSGIFFDSFWAGVASAIIIPLLFVLLRYEFSNRKVSRKLDDDSLAYMSSYWLILLFIGLIWLFDVGRSGYYTEYRFQELADQTTLVLTALTAGLSIVALVLAYKKQNTLPLSVIISALHFYILLSINSIMETTDVFTQTGIEPAFGYYLLLSSTLVSVWRIFMDLLTKPHGENLGVVDKLALNFQQKSADLYYFLENNFPLTIGMSYIAASVLLLFIIIIGGILLIGVIWVVGFIIVLAIESIWGGQMVWIVIVWIHDIMTWVVLNTAFIIEWLANILVGFFDLSNRFNYRNWILISVGLIAIGLTIDLIVLITGSLGGLSNRISTVVRTIRGVFFGSTKTNVSGRQASKKGSQAVKRKLASDEMRASLLEKGIYIENPEQKGQSVKIMKIHKNALEMTITIQDDRGKIDRFKASFDDIVRVLPKPSHD